MCILTGGADVFVAGDKLTSYASRLIRLTDYWLFQGASKGDIEICKPQTWGLRISCQLNTEGGGELSEIKQWDETEIYRQRNNTRVNTSFDLKSLTCEIILQHEK